MSAFLTVISKIVTAVIAVAIMMQLSTTVTAETRPHQFLNMQTDGIWSSVPTRVDQNHQVFERIPTPPDQFPFKFRADRQFHAVNSHQFKYKGTIYTLVGAPVIPRTMVCRKADGKRYACGLNAFRSLDNVMRGKFVECRINDDKMMSPVVFCINNGRMIAELLSV